MMAGCGEARRRQSEETDACAGAADGTTSTSLSLARRRDIPSSFSRARHACRRRRRRVYRRAVSPRGLERDARCKCKMLSFFLLPFKFPRNSLLSIGNFASYFRVRDRVGFFSKKIRGGAAAADPILARAFRNGARGRHLGYAVQKSRKRSHLIVPR